MAWGTVFQSNPLDDAPYYRKAYSKYGSSMGRHSDPPSEFVGKVNLRKVPMTGAGDYDPGGAYWGAAQWDWRGGGKWLVKPLYCAWDDEGHAIYFRAASREEAKQHLRSKGITKFKR